MIGIEGEERDIDLIHNATQKSCRFDGLDALFGENVGKGVDFQRQLTKCIVGSGAAGAKGIIFFAKRADNIGEGLQRVHNLLEQHQG